MHHAGPTVPTTRRKAEPTEEQKRIFAWITDPANARRHAMVDAKAGTGKSHTLVEASTQIGGDSVFLAFNRSIASELDGKLAARHAEWVATNPTRQSTSPMRAMTIHSLGFQALRETLGAKPGFKVEERKYKKLARRALEQEGLDPSALAVKLTQEDKQGLKRGNAELKTLIDVTLALIDKLRCTRTGLARRDDIETVCYQFNIRIGPDVKDRVISAARRALREGWTAAMHPAEGQPRVIDFADMLHLALPPLDEGGHAIAWPESLSFDWMFIDEAQDLSAAQREIVLRACRLSGRMLFVGDPAQAINGFAGASCGSFDEIREEIKAKDVFTLTGCFRCPARHLALVNPIVESITSNVTVDEGYRERHGSDPIAMSLPSYDAIIKELKPGDRVIARKKKSLTDFIARLRRDASLRKRGIQWRVLGEDQTDPYQRAEWLTMAAEDLHVSSGDPRQVPSEEMLEAAVRQLRDDPSGSVRRGALQIPKRPFASVDPVDIEDDEEDDDSDKDGVANRDVDEAASLSLAVLRETKPPTYLHWRQELARREHAERAAADQEVLLLTVHKAKGLEGDRFFILDPELLPGEPRVSVKSGDLERWGMSSRERYVKFRQDDYQQMWHLTYVAYTRARHSVFWTANAKSQGKTSVRPPHRDREISDEMRKRINPDRSALLTRGVVPRPSAPAKLSPPPARMEPVVARVPQPVITQSSPLVITSPYTPLPSAPYASRHAPAAPPAASLALPSSYPPPAPQPRPALPQPSVPPRRPGRRTVGALAALAAILVVGAWLWMRPANPPEVQLELRDLALSQAATSNDGGMSNGRASGAALPRVAPRAKARRVTTSARAPRDHARALLDRAALRLERGEFQTYEEDLLPAANIIDEGRESAPKQERDQWEKLRETLLVLERHASEMCREQRGVGCM